ncbi:hypothetical protein [Pararhizobium sp.]|uniref:hypothetical protein n=1 Tax=Pararhizobium sp. TaxID=1977563 RepID=UPI0027180A4B|nr:hypothetical protein [Pararhizobium sp.]MDO9416980.1 hypothetical protein [Pararhizobium sp.]
MDEEMETPQIDEITGSIAYELEETFKHYKMKLQSWDDLGDIEMKFPDGKRFRIEVIELGDDDDSNMADDDE